MKSSFLPGQVNTNSELSFEERAKGFEKDVAPFIELWGVSLGAVLNRTPQATIATPVLQDLWVKKDETEPL